MVVQNPKVPNILNKIFQIHLHILPKLLLIFYCHHKKIQKLSHSWHFNDHNSRGKYNNLSSLRWYISFLHFKIFKIQFHGIPLCIMFWSVKYTFTGQKQEKSLSRLLTCITFFYIKFANFWYITWFVRNCRGGLVILKRGERSMPATMVGRRQKF